MEEIHVSKTGEFVKNKKKLEKELNVKISVNGRKILIEGESVDEYEARLVLNAIDFGFSVKNALLLKNEEMIFKKIHIRSYTKRDLKVVKSRLIGVKGKTRKTMEEISNCKILIKEADVGVLGYVDDVENVVTAIIHLIRGSKQANMYSYLERMNRMRKEEGI